MKRISIILFSMVMLMLFAVSCSVVPETAVSDSDVISQQETEYTSDMTPAQTTPISTTTETTVTTADLTSVATTTTTATVASTATTIAVTTVTEPIPVKESYNGIDVSRWQGSTVDFEAVRNSGVEMVYIKAGDNYNEDMYFRQNAQNAENAGLLTGFYFYVTAGNSDEARSQAEYFATLLETVDYQCRPAVDFEAFGNLSSDSLNEIALAFAQTVEEKTGVAPIFYTDADNADIWCEELTRYPLWIADYDAEPPASIGKWSEYAGFQYSCTGVVNGITENVVDLDIYTDAVLF